MARKIEPDLPPAGHARNEELAQRQDELEAAGEQLAEAAEVESIDPKKMRVENEIAQHFDPASTMLKVSNSDPTFVYCWVYSGAHGLMITQKQIDGWEVVQGESDEALEHKGIGADTTRRVGDTLLMRIRIDQFLVLEKRRKKQAVRFTEEKTGLSEHAQQLARKYNIPIYQDGEVDARTLKRMMNNAEARKVVGRTTDKLIRQGRMPGVRV